MNDMRRTSGSGSVAIDGQGGTASATTSIGMPSQAETPESAEPKQLTY